MYVFSAIVAAPCYFYCSLEDVNASKQAMLVEDGDRHEHQLIVFY